MHPLIERLEAWLKEHRPGYHARLAPGAEADELDRLTAELDEDLPDLFRELYLWRDGTADFDPFQNNQSLASLDRIAAIRRMMRAEVERGAVDPSWWSGKWVPFLEGAGGDLTCLDLEGSLNGRPGQILYFSTDDGPLAVEYGSFEGWLRTFVEALDAGMWAEDADGNVLPVDEDAFDEFHARRNPGYPEFADDEDDDEFPDRDDDA